MTTTKQITQKSGVYMDYFIFDSTGTWRRRKYVPIEKALEEITKEYKMIAGIE